MIELELGEILRRLDDTALKMVEQAMAEDAILSDIGAAACAVHLVCAVRCKYGAVDAKSSEIAAEYLTGLSLRLMEIDGEDLAAAEAASTIILWGKK